VSLRLSPAFRYTLMRVGVFVGCFLVIWGLVAVRVLPAGLGKSNLFWVALLALVLSAPLSLVLLRKPREAMAVQVAERVDRARARLAANQAQEDEEIDRLERSERADSTESTESAESAEGVEGTGADSVVSSADSVVSSTESVDSRS
jgi:Protein of unknown function (DUF4229)